MKTSRGICWLMLGIVIAITIITQYIWEVKKIQNENKKSKTNKIFRWERFYWWRNKMHISWIFSISRYRWILRNSYRWIREWFCANSWSQISYFWNLKPYNSMVEYEVLILNTSVRFWIRLPLIWDNGGVSTRLWKPGAADSTPASQTKQKVKNLF